MSNPWERNAPSAPNFDKSDRADRNTIVDLVEPITPEVPVVDNRYIEGTSWYLSTVVNSTYNPKDSLLTHISGSRWSCTYYQQIRDRDEALDSHSSSSGVYQQYRKIERFELRVDSELAPTQNENSEMETVGSSKIFTSLIPNVGDVFIADVNDGRLAKFTVTTSRRMTLAKNTCYHIEYALIEFILNDEQLQELEDKVFQTFVFHIDYLQAGLSPFLTKEETVDRIKYKRVMFELEDSYLSEFFNFQCNTLIYPTTVPEEADEGIKYLYDPYLLTYVRQVFESQSNELKEYITSGGSSVDSFNRDTVWDLLLDRRNTRRPSMISVVSFRSCDYQYSQPHLNLLHWSPIHYYCLGRMDLDGYCISESETNNQMGVSNPMPAWTYDYGTAFNGKYDSGVGLISLVGVAPVPLNKPMEELLKPDVDDKIATDIPPVIYPNNGHVYYVFSHYWYRKEKAKYSTLESAVDDYLSNDAIDFKKIELIINDIPNWSKIDRYYNIPIVYSLLKVGLVGY